MSLYTYISIFKWHITRFRCISCRITSVSLGTLHVGFSHHYSDVIMTTIASLITSLTIVYSTVYSDADQRKHQSPASLAFVWGIHRRPVNSPHKWPVTRKMFPFDDVIMLRIYVIDRYTICMRSLVHVVPHFVQLIAVSDAYMRQWIIPPLIQIMACRLVCVMPLSDPIPGIFLIRPLGFQSKFIHFRWRKCIWKYGLQNVVQFILASIWI